MENKLIVEYSRKLNKTLISQLHNSLFYEGKLTDGAKLLTKEVAESVNADRCSIWLYSKEKISIKCVQLYLKAENDWQSGMELFSKDCLSYFDNLNTNPIIIANDALTHPATSCFKENYLIPLGIKSMLDVPIIYRGLVIGVLCIESFTFKEWVEEEVNFAQTLSSLFTFAYSIKEINKLTNELRETAAEISEKNTFLEHAAKILRHDMHSGINTYIPRGVSSLERRLSPEDIYRLKLEAPLKMIKEGLTHTQKVYKGVYEFTNLVKNDSLLTLQKVNLKDCLLSYLKSTAYIDQVEIKPLPDVEVNESLFCTAIDNLIRNGLKYNDSNNKKVSIFMEDGVLCIQDNGRGLTQEEFDYLSKPYTRKQNQKESGSGLGLNICTAILKVHGFHISCEKNNIGTKMKIKLSKDDK